MSNLPLVRCQFLMAFAELHSSIGAATEPLLEKFKLPAFLHDKEDDYVPLRNCLHFIETAARMQGIADFGYLASQRVKFAHWNQNARALILGAPTLFYALRAICARAHVDVTNLHMYLEPHGESLRICSRLRASTGMSHLEHSQWMQNLLPIEIVRQFASPDWAPQTIAFQARVHPGRDIQECWPRTQFLSGQPASWIDVPWQYLGLPPLAPWQSHDPAGVQEMHSAHELIHSLRMMLPSYLDGKIPTVMEVAEMANTSVRSLQRIFAATGFSYREILNTVKFPDGQVKFPHPWPPQIPPGRTGQIMTTRG